MRATRLLLQLSLISDRSSHRTPSYNNAMSGVDLEKLARLQAATGALRIGAPLLSQRKRRNCLLTALFSPGGKGTPRRKVIARPRPAGQGEDKKLQGALKKLNVQAMAGELSFFPKSCGGGQARHPTGRR